MRYLYLIIIMLSSLVVVMPDGLLAASRTLTATVSFMSSVSISKVSDMNFGTVQAQRAGIYTLNTLGSVTTTAGGIYLAGPTSVAQAVISGSATQNINITSDNYVSDNGVNIVSLRCRYNGGVERSCNTMFNMAAPGTGKQLLIGARIQVDGSQLPGVTANPTFDIIAIYN